MGWGDEIMAAGQARELYERHQQRVLILDRHNRPRFHSAWENNPHIAPTTQVIRDSNVIVNGPGIRPYIRDKTVQQWFWRNWRNPPGQLFLSNGEKQFARQYYPTVIVEPTIKQGASPNKNWGWERWQKLVDLLHSANIAAVQLGPPGIRRLDNVQHIVTPNLRLAAAVVQKARLVITPEGGMHHTAAAVGTRAVVLYGGFISPEQTGYDLHHNLFTGGTPCGMRIPCDHCREAMDAITPAEVASHALRLLKERHETTSRHLVT